MKIAIPDWQGRVAPVFDVCGRLWVIELSARREIGRAEVQFGGCAAFQRVRRISDLGVDVLICGAISRNMEAALTAAGIRVLAFFCGPVERVLAGFLATGSPDAAFCMPGCRRRRRRRGRH